MNFELNEILTIIDKVKSTKLETFEYQDKDIKLKIKGTKQVIAGTDGPSGNEQEKILETSEKREENCCFIEAPMVGTFYAAPSENAQPFITVGEPVKKGQTVAIIEAMKFMNEITSNVDGVVEEILVENESLVEFAQPLIRVKKGTA